MYHWRMAAARGACLLLWEVWRPPATPLLSASFRKFVKGTISRARQCRTALPGVWTARRPGRAVLQYPKLRHGPLRGGERFRSRFFDRHLVRAGVVGQFVPEVVDAKVQRAGDSRGEQAFAADGEDFEHGRVRGLFARLAAADHGQQHSQGPTGMVTEADSL